MHPSIHLIRSRRKFPTLEDVEHTLPFNRIYFWVVRRSIDCSESNAVRGVVDEFRANPAVDRVVIVAQENWLLVAHLLLCTLLTGSTSTLAPLVHLELLDIVAGGASKSRIPMVGACTADPELANDLVVLGSKWVKFHVKANNSVRSAVKTRSFFISEEVKVADVVGAGHGGLGIFNEPVVVLIVELVVAFVVEVGDDGHVVFFFRGAEGLALADVDFDFIVAALQSSPIQGKNIIDMAGENSDDSDGSRRNLHGS